jgi:hypothetical protein
MKKIEDNLFVGDDYDCLNCSHSHLIIHACKTCHQKGVGYKGNLSSSHPNYLIHEKGKHLYLNMVDMEKELIAFYTHPIMKAAMNFIERNINGCNILIHCNKGQSRSPAIGMIYLARLNKIKNKSYQEAAVDFKKIYNDYMPGRGVELYLKNNWKELCAI